MFVSKIDFASPAYDDLVQLRAELLYQPLGVELDVVELSKEYALQHYALFSNDFDLCGGATSQYIYTEEGEDSEEEVKIEKVEIQQIFVRKDLQNKGLGKFIINQIERLTAHQEIPEVQVVAIAEAKPFFQSLGYRKQGRMTTLEGKKYATLSKKIAIEDFEAVDNDNIFEDL
jgi:GNAT superfamily N-acetyltransferase